MTLLMMVIALFLTVYTFIHAKSIWKQDSKLAGFVVGLLGCAYLPLIIWLSIR